MMNDFDGCEGYDHDHDDEEFQDGNESELVLN